MKKKLLIYLAALILVALIAFLGFRSPGGKQLPVLPGDIVTGETELAVAATTAPEEIK